MSRFAKLIGAAAAAVAVVGAGASGVLAARGPAHAAAGGQALVGYGTLSSLTATGATIATPNNGSLTVTLNTGARYTAHSQAAATAGLKPGVQVAVYGTSINGTAAAGRLDYDTIAFPAAVFQYTGTVTSASSTSLSLTTASGQSVTVQITSATRYGSGLAASGATPTFTANQQVRVAAAQYTDGSLVAQTIGLPSSGRSSAAATSTSAAPAATVTPTATSTATGTP
jgi:hypothetical protein